MKFHNPFDSSNLTVQLCSALLLMLSTVLTIVYVPEIFFSVLILATVSRVIYYIIKGQ
jgi:hypothetical protein